tara:strand:+ start:2481 stop:2732 length:252 start_codon:yes stop_codon:yes gene_type:complete
MTWQDILKATRRELKKIKKYVENKIPVQIVGASQGRHMKLTVLNPRTDSTRLVVVSSTPSSSGRYDLVVRDIRRAFRKIGEDL